jgi:hypothetical protein
MSGLTDECFRRIAGSEDIKRRFFQAGTNTAFPTANAIEITKNSTR